MPSTRPRATATVPTSSYQCATRPRFSAPLPSSTCSRRWPGGRTPPRAPGRGGRAGCPGCGGTAGPRPRPRAAREAKLRGSRPVPSPLVAAWHLSGLAWRRRLPASSGLARWRRPGAGEEGEAAMRPWGIWASGGRKRRAWAENGGCRWAGAADRSIRFQRSRSLQCHTVPCHNNVTESESRGKRGGKPEVTGRRCCAREKRE